MVIEFTGVYIKVNPAAKLSVLCGIVRPAYQGICCLVKSKAIVPQLGHSWEACPRVYAL